MQDGPQNSFSGRLVDGEGILRIVDVGWQRRASARAFTSPLAQDLANRGETR